MEERKGEGRRKVRWEGFGGIWEKTATAGYTNMKSQHWSGWSQETRSVRTALLLVGGSQYPTEAT